eukprot:257969-Alexandrium_andersonii.AAC.1
MAELSWPPTVETQGGGREASGAVAESSPRQCWEEALGAELKVGRKRRAETPEDILIKRGAPLWRPTSVGPPGRWPL